MVRDMGFLFYLIFRDVGSTLSHGWQLLNMSSSDLASSSYPSLDWVVDSFPMAESKLILPRRYPVCHLQWHSLTPARALHGSPQGKDPSRSAMLSHFWVSSSSS